MNDDVCSDWYEHDEYDSQFPRSTDEDGWGIDESLYTSKLDTSMLTPEQIAMAERLAQEIEHDSVTKRRGLHMTSNPYRPPRSQNAQSFQAPPPQQQQVATMPPAAPAYQVTPPAEQHANECKVVKWLQAEMTRVLNLIGTLGEPRPDQAAKLLTTYTAQVTSMIPFSPQDVKKAVVNSFRKCNWDVLRRRPVPGSSPPSGKTLCDLIYELGVYFCQRTNQAGPPPDYVDIKLAEIRSKRPSHPTIPAIPSIPNPPRVNDRRGRGGKGQHAGRGGRGGRHGGGGGGRGSYGHGRGERQNGHAGGRGGRREGQRGGRNNPRGGTNQRR